MKIVGRIVAVLVGLALIVVLIGALLPRQHTASRAITLHRPPQEVYAAIRDFLSRFVFGHTPTIERYLSALAEHFGESGTG